MIDYTINFMKFSSVFAVPLLSEQTLCTASAEALKVLLFLMQNQAQPIEPRYLADRLMLPYQSVLSALDFWVKEGLLAAKTPRQPALLADELSERELPLTVQSNPAAPPSLSPIQSGSEQASKVSLGLKAQRKTMAIDEIHTLSQQDSSISQLVDAVQAQMGKVLTRSEIETLVSFYTYAGLPPEYILLAAAHCCTQNRPNMRALSKLLTDMMSENIYTYEQAEEYLNHRHQLDTAAGQVCSAFGIHGRTLTKQEQKYIDAWFLEYHFDISLVKLAYERAINQIGKLSFPYINKILTSWHEKGIKNAKEASTERQPAKQDNRESSSIDFDQIQQFITYGGQKPRGR